MRLFNCRLRRFRNKTSCFPPIKRPKSIFIIFWIEFRYANLLSWLYVCEMYNIIPFVNTKRETIHKHVNIFLSYLRIASLSLSRSYQMYDSWHDIQITFRIVFNITSYNLFYIRNDFLVTCTCSVPNKNLGQGVTTWSHMCALPLCVLWD